MGLGQLASRGLRNFIATGLPGSPGDAVKRFALDGIMSGAYALTVPGEYANGAERAGLFAQDLALSAGSGLLTGGLVGAGSRMAGMRLRRARELAQYGDMAGSLVVPTVAYNTGLAPMTSYLDRRAEENAQLQAEMEREGAFKQGMKAAGTGFTEGISESPYVESIDRLLSYG